jgi:hypothetical protein
MCYYLCIFPGSEKSARIKVLAKSKILEQSGETKVLATFEFARVSIKSATPKFGPKQVGPHTPKCLSRCVHTLGEKYQTEWGSLRNRVQVQECILKCSGNFL